MAVLAAYGIKKGDPAYSSESACVAFLMKIYQELTQKQEKTMLEWKDVTNSFTEPSRHWKGRYLELCEVAEGKIELSLFSSPHDSWEVYVNYSKMYGVSYVDSDNAVAHRNAMKSEIEAEYERNGLDPSDAFIDAFAKKYQLDILGALF